MRIKSVVPGKNASVLLLVLGLSAFMGWIYIVFYTSTVWVDESADVENYAWLFAMFLSSLAGAMGIVVFRKRRVRFSAVTSAHVWTAAVLLSMGTLLMAFCRETSLDNELLVLTCSGVVALGFSALTVIWGMRASELAEGRIEVFVPVAFIAARMVLFCSQMMPKDVSVILAVLLPIVSALFLSCFSKGPRVVGADAALSENEEGDGGALYGLASVTAVLLVFRFMRSFIGVVAGDSSVPYDTSALALLLVPVGGFGAFIAVALLSARSINSSVVTRWLIPIMLLTFALVPLRTETALEAARLVNVLGAVILQAFFWILFAKTGHRQRGAGALLFSCYLVGLGLGFVIGSGVALLAMEAVGPARADEVVPFVAFASVAVLMMLDGRARQFGRIGKPSLGRDAFSAADGVNVLDGLFRQQARSLASSFGLSPREEEIIAYVLAGRSRPYIRDALFISLNTVNTHVRNAYAKLGVHSQQELLDVARVPKGHKSQDGARE